MPCEHGDGLEVIAELGLVWAQPWRDREVMLSWPQKHDDGLMEMAVWGLVKVPWND